MSFEDLNQILQKLAGKITRTQEAVNRLANRMEAIEGERRMRDHINAQKEITSHLFERAQSYTRGIIFGGYAAFLAAWVFAKSVMPPFFAVLSIVCMTLSMLVFILWEVYKMYDLNSNLNKLSGGIKNNPQDIIRIQSEWQEQQQDWQIKIQPLWHTVLIWTLVFGVAGVGFLFWGFGIYLWDAFPTVWEWFKTPN